MTNNRRPQFAALFDADNISAKHAKPILDELSNHGEIALRRVYGDWSDVRLKPWREVIAQHGMVAHQQTAHSKGKNATDIGMVIDAMDMLHSNRFDGFALVSSDSDFTALANRLREAGQIVLGVGESKTPDSLRGTFTRFIQIENLSHQAGSVPKVDKALVKQAEDRLLNVIDAASDEDGWISLSALGSHVTAKYPDFDTRTYGFAKLSGLVKATTRITYRKSGDVSQARRRP